MYYKSFIYFVVLLKLVNTATLKDFSNNEIDSSLDQSSFDFPQFSEDEARPKACVPSDLPPDSRSGCCGVQRDDGMVHDDERQKRSVGGKKTPLYAYPWAVFLEKDEGLMCTGFLISGRYVVTAAHCTEDLTKPYNVTARLGEYDKNNEGPDCIDLPDETRNCTEGATRIPVADIIQHEDYDAYDSYLNDIALIKLQELAPYTDFIRPICLPTTDVTANVPRNLMFEFVGWGAVAQVYDPMTKTYTEMYYNEKLHLQLPYKSLEECQTIHDKSSVENNEVYLWNRQICAGGVQGEDPCYGDSGGPLMYRNIDSYEVVGTLSFGGYDPCGSASKDPNVFTKIYEYKDWIQTAIQRFDIRAARAKQVTDAKLKHQVRTDF